MPDPFTQLLEWRRNEAAGRGLAKLPIDYYASTRTYLEELRRSYELDLRENPSSRKGEISRQTYQRASQVARDILEGRVQKILSLAFQASIGGTLDLPNALPEERSMFDDLVATLNGHRQTSAPYLAPVGALSTSPHPPSAPASRPADPPASPPAAPVASSPTYVRILENGHTIEVGADTVELRADDLVSLPVTTAQLLVNSKVAEPIRVHRPGAG